MKFESSIGKFKETQSLLFTAVIRTKNFKFEKSIQFLYYQSQTMETLKAKPKTLHLLLNFLE
jgi:hypothetical protein